MDSRAARPHAARAPSREELQRVVGPSARDAR